MTRIPRNSIPQVDFLLPTSIQPTTIFSNWDDDDEWDDEDDDEDDDDDEEEEEDEEDEIEEELNYA